MRRLPVRHGVLLLMQSRAKGMAIAGIGGAVSLAAVTLAFFFPSLSLTFYAMSAFGVMLPLSGGYYRESMLAVAAVTVIGAFYASLTILVFLLITGGFTVAAVICDAKRVKPYIYFPAVAVYASLVWLLFYFVTSIFFYDFSSLAFLQGVNESVFYTVMNLLFAAGAFIYHFGAVYAARGLTKLVKRNRD